MAAQEIAQFSSRHGSHEQLVVISDAVKIYVGTTLAVMAAYALLLMISSTNYIQIAAIPAIILAFIGALWAKFRVNGRLQHRNNGTANLGSGSRQAWRMLPMLLHPIGTTFAILAAYALLLMISINYIQIAAIPAIILAFIGALWGNFWVKGRLRHRNNGTANLGSGSGQAWRMLPMVLLSYCLQLIQLACAQATNGEQSDNFLLSHSLLFLSSALGALAVMIAALPIRATQGVAQGQQLIHRIFIVVLVIAVHIMATEWMEEDMLLVCMPEFIAVMMWFTVYFDHAGCRVSVDKVTSRRSIVIFLAAAMILVAFMFSFENEMVLVNYWHRRILCCCTLSGLLSCLCVCMILQWWPAISANVPLDWPSDSAIVPIRILEFSAVICFAMSAMLLFIGFLLNYSIL